MSMKLAWIGAFLVGTTQVLPLWKFLTDPGATTIPIVSTDFDREKIVGSLYLSEGANASMKVTARVIVHWPTAKYDSADENWKTTGVMVSGSLQNEIEKLNLFDCEDPASKFETTEAIDDGAKRMEASFSCQIEVPASGSYFYSVEATAIGPCEPTETNPRTCNTRVINGSLAIQDNPYRYNMFELIEVISNELKS